MTQHPRQRESDQGSETQQTEVKVATKVWLMVATQVYQIHSADSKEDVQLQAKQAVLAEKAQQRH